MNRRIDRVCVALLFALGAVAVGAKLSPGTGRDITGIYVHSHGDTSTLEIRAEGAEHVAELSGGDAGAAGAEAPADCYVRAVGRLEGDTLAAQFTALETETFVYSRSQAERERRQLKIAFGPDTAEVVRADTFGYCGLGVSFVGVYRRQEGRP